MKKTLRERVRKGKIWIALRLEYLVLGKDYENYKAWARDN